MTVSEDIPDMLPSQREPVITVSPVSSSGPSVQTTLPPSSSSCVGLGPAYRYSSRVPKLQFFAVPKKTHVY